MADRGEPVLGVVKLTCDDPSPRLAARSRGAGAPFAGWMRPTRASLPNVFVAGKNGGLTYAQIAQAFQHPSIGRYVPVGRSSASGTRKAFVRNVLNGDDSSENNAGPCPSASGTCLEDTTMDLLTYVNKTPNAIGYAEAGALPFSPDVGAIPIDGYEPTRANALNGTCTFLATEHLYTSGIRAGLAAERRLRTELAAAASCAATP